MADVKINDLSLAAVTSGMQLETDIGGATANKVTAEGIKDYVKANLGDFSAGYVQVTQFEAVSDSPSFFRVKTDTGDLTLIGANPDPLFPANSDVEFDAHIVPLTNSSKSIGYADKRFIVGYFNDVNCENIFLSSVADGVLNISSDAVSSEVATSLATDGTLVRRGGAGITSFRYASFENTSTPGSPSINFGGSTTGIAGTESQVTVHIEGTITATFTSSNTEFSRVRVSDGSFADPAITFSSTSYGFYSSGTSINVKVGGTDKITFGSSTVDVLAPMRTKHQTTEKTASFSLNYNDRDEIIYVNSSSNLTVTAPSSTTDPSIQLGSSWVIVRKGTGSVTLVEDSGVTILSVDSAKTIANRYGGITIVKTASNEYHAMGDLV